MLASAGMTEKVAGVALTILQTDMILYIHGFNSSPASFKARLLRDKLESMNLGHEFLAPDLPHLPSQAIKILEKEIAGRDPRSITLVGSSLGGCYATWLAEKYGVRAVLVNPAVKAHQLLKDDLGPQKNLHSGEEYELTERHIEELKTLDVSMISDPSRYLLLVTTGDEVLDYRQAVQKYQGAAQMVIEGGDHGFSNFGDYLDRVLRFSGYGAL